MMFAIIALSGCAATSGNYCDIAKPIFYDSADELEKTPDNIVRRVDLHNTVYFGLCR